jgi:hypothetical protein
MTCGLLLGVADMNWRSFLAFSLAMVPYLSATSGTGYFIESHLALEKCKKTANYRIFI